MTTALDGAVIYTDGSFRRNRAGWGIHGYTYQCVPLTRGTGNKQVPTEDGYNAVALTETVTPIKVFDGFGGVKGLETNNTGELTAMVEAFKCAFKLDIPKLLVRTDSQYVRDGLNKYYPTWVKNDWIKPDGEPVKNRELWLELVALKERWVAENRRLEIRWVKAHDGEPGNEAADANSRMGSGNPEAEASFVEKPFATKNESTPTLNPLLFKGRVLFQIDRDHVSDGYYCVYSLGRAHTYGHKQTDGPLEKIAKTDLILGRRLAEACFAVFKTNTPQEYIDSLIRYHTESFYRGTIELGVLRLDNAYKTQVYQRVTDLGNAGLVKLKGLHANVSPHDEMVTRTHTPPKMAYHAVETFNVMRDRLDAHLGGTLGAAVISIDVTDKIFVTTTTGKKTVTKLVPGIEQTTQFIHLPVEIRGVKTRLKPILGLDWPVRNALAKIAGMKPKATLLITMDGPLGYSYSTVFETDDGAAIYTSPYTQFALER